MRSLMRAHERKQANPAGEFILLFESTLVCVCVCCGRPVLIFYSTFLSAPWHSATVGMEHEHKEQFVLGVEKNVSRDFLRDTTKC
jgi:hypothetical protein